MKKTKIVCTLGPASTNESTLRQMLIAGMNVARFNLSHGTHQTHKEAIDMFRKVRDKLKLPAAVMLDTRGPEIRIGDVENNFVCLIPCQDFILTTEEVLGNSNRVSITYKDLPRQVACGQKILIDDGRILLTAISTTETQILCKVIEGGNLSSKKSINIPCLSLDMEYLSPKDEADLLFGIENDVDFIAASFVRSANDVISLRKFLDYHGGHSIKIISKIENIQGVNNFDEILKHSSGIMVARGDMGVEVEFEKLPGLQKKFIKKCYQSGKMVITATQMLESMINNFSPTRAEITDVANAVFDGTSAVMLSGETTIGVDPARVVKVMAKIVEQAEKDAFDLNLYDDFHYENDVSDTTNAICDAACTTSRDIKASAIIAVTKSGQTARRVSKFRPFEPIVAATPELKTFHQLSLSWGVYPVFSLYQTDVDSLFHHAIDCAKQIDLVKRGDRVVITSGVPTTISGTTNLLKVETVI